MTDTLSTSPNAGLAHIRATATDKLTEKSVLVRSLERFHVSTRYDKLLTLEIEKMLTTILSGGAKEGYALAVVGKSGAGKTHAINHALDGHAAFKPFMVGVNELQICMRVRTPPVCSTKSLGVAILQHVGYPLLRTKLNEIEIWRLVREQLKRREIRIIYLDEAQHVLKAKKSVTEVTDTIKSLMQDPTWPVWVIMSGIPQMLEIIEGDGDHQLERRSRVLRIGDLKEEDFPTIVAIVKAIASRVSFKVGFPMNTEFVGRMVHGGMSLQGMVIQLIKLSIETAIWDEKEAKTRTVRFDHFVEGYRRLCNCGDDTNVFLAKDWRNIVREVSDEGKLTEELARR
ncbi:TniB family NTP-binding protein [Rhizobium ruizarguesonis]|uniref:TniB family NTP-binding protein n=1 Tax=Rhizobium ruizarguesonis TaxID=2081791 RepID=UPI0013EEB28B|nr:ATP-binding protein [Rhizobium ruizarguesonis]